MNYHDLIDGVTEHVIGNESNVIIIGSNASGKTDIIKAVHNKLGDNDCYLIDSVNKKFDLQYLMFDSNRFLPNLEGITKNRFLPNVLNLKDTFGDGPIENIVCHESIKSKYEALLSEYFGEEVFFERVVSDFDKGIANGQYTNAVSINSRRIYESDLDGLRLSDGQQSLFRILLELLFCQTKIKMEKNDVEKHKKFVVLIDEIDSFLDKRNAQKILNFIVEKFKNFQFILTTHSSDVLFGAKKADVIALIKSDFVNENLSNEYYVYSADDIDSISSAENIINMTMNGKDEGIQFRDADEIVLSKLFNHAISGCFTNYDSRDLELYSQKELSNTNRLLYEQIKQMKYGKE